MISVSWTGASLWNELLIPLLPEPHLQLAGTRIALGSHFARRARDPEAVMIAVSRTRDEARPAATTLITGKQVGDRRRPAGGHSRRTAEPEPKVDSRGSRRPHAEGGTARHHGCPKRSLGCDARAHLPPPASLSWHFLSSRRSSQQPRAPIVTVFDRDRAASASAPWPVCRRRALVASSAVAPCPRRQGPVVRPVITVANVARRL